jgi:hypothetical protein
MVNPRPQTSGSCPLVKSSRRADSLRAGGEYLAGAARVKESLPRLLAIFADQDAESNERVTAAILTS